MANIVYLGCEPLYKKDGFSERVRGICSGLGKRHNLELHTLGSLKIQDGITDFKDFKEFRYKTIGRACAYYAANFFENTGISGFLRGLDMRIARKAWLALQKADIVIFEDLTFAPSLAKLKKKMQSRGKKLVLICNLHNVYKEDSTVEKFASLNSDLILVCSEEERNLFLKKYSRLGIDENKILIVENGMTPAQVSLRENIKKRSFFIGSAYKPNAEAVRFIIKLSEHLEDWEHVIVGGVCELIDEKDKKERMKNMKFLGKLERTEIEKVIADCGIALCPLFEGSGTSLKMVDYLTHALPTVSTRLGARGLGLTPGVHYLEAESIDEFVYAIKKLENDNELYKRLSYEGKKSVDERFDWIWLAEKINKRILELIEKNKR
ncbi:MAG: glycosyltransferase family 4 protein [Thermoplasmata archaeon]